MEGNEETSYLLTAKTYKNYHLKLDYKPTGTEGFINGGISFHAKPLTENPKKVKDYQADIGHGYTGFIYDENRLNGFVAVADPELIKP